jgi:hypothetical protein
MIALIYWLLLLPHPVHLSVSEINYSEKDKAFQITSRIFIDDLELGIRAKRGEPALDIIEPGNGQTTDKMVAEYLDEHFVVKVDGKPQKLVLLGTEKEEVALICYIEIRNIKKVKTFEVTNTVITEIHDDQSNLVHITYKGPIRSVRLMRDKPTEIFTFNK